MPLKCQLIAVRKHRPAARKILIALLQDDEAYARFCSGADDRLIEGFSEFGDNSFRYRPERLEMEAIQEIEDFFNWMPICLWRKGQ